MHWNVYSNQLQQNTQLENGSASSPLWNVHSQWEEYKVTPKPSQLPPWLFQVWKCFKKRRYSLEFLFACLHFPSWLRRELMCALHKILFAEKATTLSHAWQLWESYLEKILMLPKGKPLSSPEIKQHLSFPSVSSSQYCQDSSRLSDHRLEISRAKISTSAFP